MKNWEALAEQVNNANNRLVDELAESERSRTELIKQNAALAAENERLQSTVDVLTAKVEDLKCMVRTKELIIRSKEDGIDQMQCDVERLETHLKAEKETSCRWKSNHDRLAEIASQSTARAEKAEAVIKAAQSPAYELNYQYDEGQEDPELGGDLIFHQLNAVDYPPGTLFYAAPVPAQSPEQCKTEYVPISADMKSVFIDGLGLIPIQYPSHDRCPSHEPVEDNKLYRQVSNWYARLTNAEVITDNDEHAGYCCTMKMMDEMESILSIGLPEVMQAYGVQNGAWLQDEAGKCADSCKDWPQWRKNAVTGEQDSGVVDHE